MQISNRKIRAFHEYREVASRTPVRCMRPRIIRRGTEYYLDKFLICVRIIKRKRRAAGKITYVTVSSMFASRNGACTFSIYPLLDISWKVLANICSSSEGPECNRRYCIRVRLDQANLTFVPGSQKLMRRCGPDESRVRNTSETNARYMPRGGINT